MKNKLMVLLGIALLTSCSPVKQQSLPSQTGAVLQTGTAPASLTPNPTVTPTQISTATLQPDTAIYKFLPGTTEEEKAAIIRGITRARQYLAQNFGGDITKPYYVFAGPGATLLGQTDTDLYFTDALMNYDYSGERVYINTVHRYILEGGLTRLEKSAIHEVTHVWQVQNNCANPPGIDWLREGQAEYLGTLLAYGQFLQKEAVNHFWMRHGQNMESMLGANDYSIKTEAFKWLIDHSSPIAYTTFCQSAVTKLSADEAFEAAFGMSLGEFYIRFQKQYVDPRSVNPVDPALLSFYEKQLQDWEFLNPTLTSPNLKIQFEDMAGNPLGIKGFAICPPIGGCTDVRDLDNGFIEFRLFPGVYGIRAKQPGNYSGWTVPPTYNYHFEVSAYEPRTLEIRLDTLATVSYQANGQSVNFDYGGDGIAYWLYSIPSPKTIIAFHDSAGNPVPNLPLLVCEVFNEEAYECHGKLTDEAGLLQDTLYTVFPYVIFANTPGENLTAPFDYRTEEFFPFGDKDFGVPVSYTGQEEFTGKIVLEGAVEGQTIDLKFLLP